MREFSTMSVIELMELGGVELHDNSHFIYTSGLHGSGYANLRALAKEENLPVLRELSFRLICNALEAMQPEDGDRIVVVGPETLGAIIAKEGVEEYNRRDPLRNKPLEHGSFIHDPESPEMFLWGASNGIGLIQPDPNQPPGKVIWVDDLLNQASTWRRTNHLVSDMWPNAIEVVATVADRSKETPESLGVPMMVCLRKLDIDSFEPDECPQCTGEIPIVRKPGHGHAYEKKHPDYTGGYTDHPT